MTDRLLTDAERDKLLMALARAFVATHAHWHPMDWQDQSDQGFCCMRCEETAELRGALQSIEEANKQDGS